MKKPLKIYSNGILSKFCNAVGFHFPIPGNIVWLSIPLPTSKHLYYLKQATNENSQYNTILEIQGLIINIKDSSIYNYYFCIVLFFHGLLKYVLHGCRVTFQVLLSYIFQSPLL